ncbi:MAG: class I SAM-dependent methyltransferase [Lachnospiraceae bacterium]|nr:class I SAM-dependent methyltransferase [Lachnospiraceae bacterium]
MSELILVTEAGADQKKSTALAEKLQISVVSETNLQEESGLFLKLGQDGLSLRQGKLEMRGDFVQMLPRLKQGRLQGEMLVKAAKLKNFPGTPVVLDATAGMGEDSMLLAAAGYEVFLFEKDPVIAALLEDALDRAAQDAVLQKIVGRMHLQSGDSINAMQEGRVSADIVYLDPMFPARSKSGLIKKKFQLLQQLERPCADEEELLQAALAVHPKRIVIKRPAKGPYLAGRKPSYSIAGKAVRYDCLVP